MPKATGTITTPRPDPLPGGARPSADAELIQLCRHFLPLEPDWRRAANRDAMSGETDPALEALDVQYNAAMEAITAIPARTLDGLRAKAAAVIAFYAPDPPDDYLAERMMWSLVQDAAGRAAS